MDVDTQYPALSSLAQLQGCTLNELGKSAVMHDKYLKFADCCRWVLKDLPRGSLGPYHYLATLEELVSRFGTTSLECYKLWRKLTKGPESGFLDTVAEAAWAVHFLNMGLSVSLERPFDSSVSNSKDADIVVTLDGVERWLDVLNVDIASFNPPNSSPIAPFIPLPTPTELTDKFAARAQKKYKDKFKQAIRSGSLKGCSVGVLVSIFKTEKVVILQLLNGVKLPFPNGLFGDNNPGLDLVYIYTFRSGQASDLMRPIAVAEWKRT